jgi:hypothetical protein
MNERPFGNLKRWQLILWSEVIFVVVWFLAHELT